MLRAVVIAGRFADLRLWSHQAGREREPLLRELGFGPLTTAGTERYPVSLLAYDLQPLASFDRLPELAGWRLSMIDSDKC